MQVLRVCQGGERSKSGRALLISQESNPSRFTWYYSDHLLPKLRVLSLWMWCQVERQQHSVTAHNTIILLTITVQTSS